MSCIDSGKPSCTNCARKVCCDELFCPSTAPVSCEVPCTPTLSPEKPPCEKPSRLKLDVPPEDDGKLWKSTKIVAPPKPVKWRCPEKKKVVKKKKPKGLGVPVGVCFGSFSIFSPTIKIADDLVMMQGYAICLKAFGEIYITPEEEWDNGVMNRILAEGRELLKTNLEAEKVKFRLEQEEKAEKEAQEKAKAAKTTTDTKGTKKKPEPGAKAAEKLEEYTSDRLTEKHISKQFFICGNSVEIEVLEPFVIGVLMSTDRRVPNFYYGIEKFMRKFKYCLLTVCKQYYLIWKGSGVFFVYDCYGRNKILMRRPLTGYSALISLCSLENVNHFIVKMSKLAPTEPFMIRKIKMIQVIASSTVDTKIARRVRQREFEVVNDYHAVLKGHLHLATSCFKEYRNKFALAVAITAIIITKIDSPSTWDRYCVDKVLTTAHKFYSLWTNCNHTVELLIRNIPAEIKIGKFNCFIKISQPEACGMWMCIPNYKRSDLTIAIKKVFQNSSNLVVQVSYKIYGLVKRGDFYYLFDPYTHLCSSGKSRIPFATFHMFSTLNMLCCYFSNEVLELPVSSPFYIYSVMILHIENTTKPLAEIKTCICSKVHRENETISLNDSLGDLTGKKELTCVAEKYGFVPDEGNLDSPGMSQTQIILEYDELKGDKDDDDHDEEGSEADDLSESGSEDSAGGKKKGKGKSKKGKGDKEGKEGKGKKGKDKKDKGDKEKKEKKGKGKKDKGTKDKDKDDKEKKEKERKEKEKKEKERKEKEQKEKEMKEKEKREKGKKDKDKDNGSSSEDGGEEGEDGEGQKSVPEGCLPNSYPGYSCVPYNLAVAGSESGDYESLCNLIKVGFKCSDRILTMTPWGNYVVFKSKTAYLLYDGCTCCVNRFRHLDLTVGTAGLLCFWTLHDVLEYILRARGNKTSKALKCEKKYLDKVIGEICENYCGNSC